MIFEIEFSWAEAFIALNHNVSQGPMDMNKN